MNEECGMTKMRSMYFIAIFYFHFFFYNLFCFKSFYFISHFCHSAFRIYSALNASIGSILAAFLAGKNPAKKPAKIKTANASKTTVKSTSGFLK